MTAVRKGDLFAWDGIAIRVTRVSSQWADIRCRESSGYEWSKRQPLPFPAAFVRVEGGAE